MHERLLAIGFLDYSFKTMLRQLIFPYCIYIVYPRFCFLVAIQPRLAAKRDKRWVFIPLPFRPSATFPRKRGEGIYSCNVRTWARAKRGKCWARGQAAKRGKCWARGQAAKRDKCWARAKRRHYWACQAT